MWPGERTACLYPPLPPSFPPRCFNHIFNSNLLLFDPPGVAERGGRVFLAVLKAAGAAGGDRAGCCGRVELDGIPPPRFFPPPPLRTSEGGSGAGSPFPEVAFVFLCRFPEQPGRGEAGRGRDQAGLDQPPLLLLAPPEPAELLRFSRGGTFRAPPRPGAAQPPPDPPMAPPRCSCPGSWTSRRHATPGKAVGALVPDPRVLVKPPDSPGLGSSGEGAPRDLRNLLSAPKPRAGAD